MTKRITLSLENIDEYIGYQQFGVDYCARNRDNATFQSTKDYWQGGIDSYSASLDRLVKIKEYLQKELIEVLPTSFKRARPIEDADEPTATPTEDRARALRTSHTNNQDAHQPHDRA